MQEVTRAVPSLGCPELALLSWALGAPDSRASHVILDAYSTRSLGSTAPMRLRDSRCQAPPM